MKINVWDDDQLDGEQSRIVVSYENGQPGEESLAITKRAFEGDEFFDEAKKLIHLNRGLAELLTNEWIRARAYEAVENCIPETKLSDYSNLAKLYFRAMTDISKNLKALAAHIKQYGVESADDDFLDHLSENLLRQFYPNLRKSTKKYNGLIHYIRESFWDGIQLYTESNIRLEYRQSEEKIS